MNHHKVVNITLVVLLAVLASIGMTAVASAATIVDWGGDYVDSDQALLAGGYDNTNGDFLAITPSAPDYTGPEIAGQLITSGEMKLVDEAPDRVQLKHQVWALALFQKETFLADGDSLTANFDATSQVTTNLNTNVGRDNYLVLRSGSTYYRSEEIWDGTGTVSLTPTSLSWYAYDPVTDPSDLTGGSASIVSGGEIGDITAIGIFNSKIGGSEATRFDSFVITANVIPEPASLILLLLALPFLRFRRRR